jgi:deazaflavin-dependent oxidoreductase (nitroreductase family)
VLQNAKRHTDALHTYADIVIKRHKLDRGTTDLTPRQICPYTQPMPVDVDSRLGRLVIKASGTKTFMHVGPKIVPHLDRALHKISGGRMIMSRGMLPSLVLTTTGAKTGQRRTTPLATKPENGSWYVVGSNFGRDNHPAWTANLLANPDADVSFEAKDTPVRAHLLSPTEKAAFWPQLVKFWPNYDLYVKRSGRDLRVFRLDPR